MKRMIFAIVFALAGGMLVGAHPISQEHQHGLLSPAAMPGVWMILAPVDANRLATMSTGFAYVGPGGVFMLVDFDCELIGYLTWRIHDDKLFIGAVGGDSIGFDIEGFFGFDYELETSRYGVNELILARGTAIWLTLESGMRWRKMSDDIRMPCRQFWRLADDNGRTDGRVIPYKIGTGIWHAIQTSIQ